METEKLARALAHAITAFEHMLCAWVSEDETEVTHAIEHIEASERLQAEIRAERIASN